MCVSRRKNRKNCFVTPPNKNWMNGKNEFIIQIQSSNRYTENRLTAVDLLTSFILSFFFSRSCVFFFWYSRLLPQNKFTKRINEQMFRLHTVQPPFKSGWHLSANSPFFSLCFYMTQYILPMFFFSLFLWCDNENHIQYGSKVKSKNIEKRETFFFVFLYQNK